ncbi:hypothetical protein ACHQM5_021842 [Ranunculus cassubicifolius]
MELKLSFFVLVAFLVLCLARPTLSRGLHHKEESDNDVYEIDYRGPETHSFVPPPDRSHSNPLVHDESVMARHKPKAPKGHKARKSGRKTRG